MNHTKMYSRATAAMAVDYNREVTEVTHMVRDVRVFHAIDPLAEHLTFISRQLQRLKQKSAFACGVTSPVYQYTGALLIVGALAVARNVQSLDLTAVCTIALLVLRSLSYGQQLQNS
jgi:ATP-binding cassette, subfamily B, bacterial